MVKQAKRRKKSKGKPGLQLLGVAGFITGIVFMGTTILLLFAMLPTIVAAVIDRNKGTKPLTVGAMNLAGCTPFLLQLWTKGNTPATAVEIILDPSTIIVIYCAAGIGYLIDWAMGGIISTVMVSKSNMRLGEIKKEQEELVRRWGREVTGEIPLDDQGFPVEGLEDMAAEKPRG